MEKNQKFSGVIRKAVITPKGFLSVNSVDHLGTGDDIINRAVTSKTEGVVHKDLRKAFNVLRGHVAAVVGGLKKSAVKSSYINLRECETDPELSGYTVTGITLNPTDDGETVKIHVQKQCVEGGHIEFVTPAVDLYQGSDYEFSGNLSDDISDCKIEIARYMDGKFDDYGQMTLFVSEDGEMVEQTDEPF